MKIEYVEGNLFNGSEEIICHGCNAQGVMGSGIAKIVKEDYNYAFQDYRTAYEKCGLQVGMIVVSEGNFGQPIIINAITQENYGRNPSTRYVSYLGVRKAIKRVNSWVKDADKRGCTIAFPMIGAGLGNGDWDTIANILEQESVDFIPRVYRYKDEHAE